jgi:endonuclease G, mitochondrial
MRTKRFVPLVFIIGYFVTSFAQGIEVPQIFPKEKTVTHTAYTTSYSHDFGQPHWVAYSLDYSKLISVAARPSRFQPDPKIKPATTSHRAYTKTGFDRGHLAPAADMAWSTQTMLESFYTSNISPQRPAFNRGIWKVLESKVREWTLPSLENGLMPHLFIVTGPIFSSEMPNISRVYGHTLSVPEYFFKAIIDTTGSKRGIAFILPNNKVPTERLWDYTMSIDELELKLGRDLFPKLPDEIETKIEAQNRRTDWE